MSDGNQPAWHSLEARDVCARFKTGDSGLCADEARRRLEIYGPNALRSAERANGWRIVLHQFTGALQRLHQGPENRSQRQQNQQ